MDRAQLLRYCPVLWHVGPPGSWDGIARHGLRTAQQLIDGAALDEEERRRLTDEPRRQEVRLQVGGETAVLRDQGPLFARRDLTPVLTSGMTIADWIRLLNARTYLFADRGGRRKILDKYGSQDVITFDTEALLDVCGPRLELANQNTGAIARRSTPYKDWDTFRPVARFPAQRPREVTVLDGLTSDEVRRAVTTVEQRTENPG